MKLNPKFLTHETKGEHYMISTSGTAFKGIVKNNQTAALIIETLKTDTTQSQIVDKILERYTGTDRKTVERDVSDIIRQLDSIGAIEQ